MRRWSTPASSSRVLRPPEAASASTTHACDEDRRRRAAVRVLVPTGNVRAAASCWRRRLSAAPRQFAHVARSTLRAHDGALAPAQRESIGWKRRQSVGDVATSSTTTGRRATGASSGQLRRGVPLQRASGRARRRRGTFACSPALLRRSRSSGVRFSHRWGSAIDTCSRFSVFFGTAHGGRVAYAVGYGARSSRHASARVGLDLLDGRQTEAMQLQYVRSSPCVPAGAAARGDPLTRNRLDAADRNAGRRSLWLARSTGSASASTAEPAGATFGVGEGRAWRGASAAAVSGRCSSWQGRAPATRVPRARVGDRGPAGQRW
jgi:hypothetical protein